MATTGTLLDRFGPSESNRWTGQRDSDEAHVITRALNRESITSGVLFHYNSNERWYLLSATGGAAVQFGSATKNTGITNFVCNAAPGAIVVSAAGGTLHGSATQSDGTTMWRSDGSVWHRLFPGGAAAAAAPTSVAENGGITITYPNGDLHYTTSTSAGGAVTLSFADPATVLGQTITVAAVSGKAIAQTPAGVFIGWTSAVASATIPGSTVYFIATFRSDASNWLVTGANIP